MVLSYTSAQRRYKDPLLSSAKSYANLMCCVQ